MDGAGEDNGNIRLFRLNPFMQPPIVQALFQHLTPKDLANCRLVSKLWYNESLSTCRSNATLKFGNGGIISKRTTSLGEFLDLWEADEWGSCPFKKFLLHSWNFEAGDVEQQRFMDLVGLHITSLTLVDCSFVGRENFRRIIYQAFPALQFLKICLCTVKDICQSDPWEKEEMLSYREPAFGVHGLTSLHIKFCWPQSMMDMLCHFHKLDNLRIYASKRDFYRLLEVIKLIRAQDQTKLPLKNFDVKFTFELRRSTASYIELLKLHNELNLPIQRLEFYSPSRERMDINSPNVISDVIQYHSSTLRNLEFSGQTMNLLCKSFPSGFNLENLKKLHIGKQFGDNLNYLRYTPNLRLLSLLSYGRNDDSDNLFSNSSQLEIGDWTLPSLTELGLFRFSPLSHWALGKLMKWMPNVEHLWNIELDDVQFSMICENWKNLKHLTDMGSRLTDEGVIGIENGHEADGNEGSQSGPNITKLKNLTVFYTCSSKLTSASVREGFLKLNNLKALALGDSTELDDEAKTALKGRNISSRNNQW